MPSLRNNNADQIRRRRNLYNGFRHFEGPYYTYDGPDTSCVGKYDDVVEHMERHQVEDSSHPDEQSQQKNEK